MKKFTIEDSSTLRTWLEEQGFRVSKWSLSPEGNLVDWYAYRQSKIPARPCECNSDKKLMQLIVKPYVIKVNNQVIRHADVELRAEFKGIWWSFTAYGLRFSDLGNNLDMIEANLIKAWNAMV